MNGDGRPGSNDDQESETVQDDGHAETAAKDRILNARERLDAREDDLFAAAAADPNLDLTYQEAVRAWGTSVRQYIRAAAPLLKSDTIEEADYYWKEKHIWSEEFPPPDGKKEWSRFVKFPQSDLELIREMNLSTDFTPPEKKLASIQGLKGVLERPNIDLVWYIEWEGNVDEVGYSTPLPKEALENAVMATDDFLQDAGVGLDIGSGDPHGKT